MKTMKISGMSCMHCQMRVEKALKALEGVQNVTVDFRLGQATFEASASVDELTLKNAVKEAGYKPGKIEG